MLDDVPMTGSVTMRILPMRNIDAEEFAKVVRELFAQGKALGKIPGTTLTGAPQGDVGTALADDFALTVVERTNTVIVAGRDEAVALVEAMQQRLDTTDASAASAVRSYPLARAGATAVSQRLEQFFNAQAQQKNFRPEDKVRMVADDRTNTLVVSTSQRSFSVLEELLKQLDREIPADLRELKLVQLTHASATRLAPLIQQLMDSRPSQILACRPDALNHNAQRRPLHERLNRVLVV